MYYDAAENFLSFLRQIRRRPSGGRHRSLCSKWGRPLCGARQSIKSGTRRTGYRRVDGVIGRYAAIMSGFRLQLGTLFMFLSVNVSTIPVRVINFSCHNPATGFVRTNSKRNKRSSSAPHSHPLLFLVGWQVSVVNGFARLNTQHWGIHSIM